MKKEIILNVKEPSELLKLMYAEIKGVPKGKIKSFLEHRQVSVNGIVANLSAFNINRACGGVCFCQIKFLHQLIFGGKLFAKAIHCAEKQNFAGCGRAKRGIVLRKSIDGFVDDLHNNSSFLSSAVPLTPVYCRDQIYARQNLAKAGSCVQNPLPSGKRAARSLKQDSSCSDR